MTDYQKPTPADRRHIDSRNAIWHILEKQLHRLPSWTDEPLDNIEKVKQLRENLRKCLSLANDLLPEDSPYREYTHPELLAKFFPNINPDDLDDCDCHTSTKTTGGTISGNS